MPSTARPERVHHYRSVVFDSDRWDGFALRAGDIVVCTPPKSGTTWTQMLCALLVHRSKTLPQPLTRLSRWVERLSQPIEEVAAELGEQPFRRVLKSHTPLDGLPYSEDVSYVVCGRDPRDAFLSMLDHMGNLSAETMAEIAERSGAPPGEGFPTGPNDLFRMWQTVGLYPWTEDGFPFGSFTHLLGTYWNFRQLPNIHFLHYADLKRNLEGETRGLSAFLGIEIDENLWPELIQAASFDSMREKADDAAPGAHLGEWVKNADFFRMARMGQWREVLSAENKQLYEELNGKRLDPALKAWIEGGRTAADPKAG